MLKKRIFQYSIILNFNKAKKIMHGKTSMIKHLGSGIFNKISLPMQVTRHHSLIVNPSRLSLKLPKWPPHIKKIDNMIKNISSINEISKSTVCRESNAHNNIA